MAICSILLQSLGRVGVGCVADSFLEELDCPSGLAVTRAQVSVGRYVYQIMLHSVEHAESVVSSSYSGSHSRSSSIFVTHPGVLVE